MAKLFIAPFILYLVGTSIVARFGDAGYPLAYSVLVVFIGAVMLWLRRDRDYREAVHNNQPPVKLHWKVWPGLLVGLVGIALWIAISELRLEQYVAQYLPAFLQPSERVGFNPWEHLDTDWKVWVFLAFRVFGIALIVPIAEELFWRGFLLRWLIDPEWERVGIGDYTLQSCAIVTLMFTVAHPEWLAAALYCLLINGLLYWRRDLWLCIVAHSVSNLALVGYVLANRAWWLW